VGYVDLKLRRNTWKKKEERREEEKRIGSHQHIGSK
jgi:hypothetical protein